MKRIHLFEFEDFPWFPNWIRTCLTRLMVVMHTILNSKAELAGLLRKALTYTNSPAIIDLCSGSGGPMLEAFTLVAAENQPQGLKLTLTDLYPDKALAYTINQNTQINISYLTTPVDATNVPPALTGLRTMVCSFHHMAPDTARKILADAQVNRQPICIFEISDNSFPIWLWWVALPLNFLMAFFITPFVRPLTWKQIIFTYLLPIIPFFFAWDGAVSNARTYTLNDLQKLIQGLESEDYIWEKNILKGKSKKIYLLGLPVNK